MLGFYVWLCDKACVWIGLRTECGFQPRAAIGVCLKAFKVCLPANQTSFLEYFPADLENFVLMPHTVRQLSPQTDSALAHPTSFQILVKSWKDLQ